MKNKFNFIFFYLVIFTVIFAVPVTADPDINHQSSIGLGNIVEWQSPDVFSDSLFIKGSIPLGQLFVLQTGVITDIKLEQISAHLLLGAEEISDFLSIRLNSIYESFPSSNLAEFTALNSWLLSNDFLELELGIGWRYLFNLTEVHQHIDNLHLAYRFEWSYINNDICRLSLQFGNFNNFSLGNISDVTYSMKNEFFIGDNFELDIFLHFHNPGAWAFSSYYSGCDLGLEGIYRFEN